MPNLQESYPVYHVVDNKLEKIKTQASSMNLKALQALLNFETNLPQLQTCAYCILVQALKHTGDPIRQGGYLLLDEGNQNPVIIPVGTITEDKLEKYPAVVHAKWEWLRNNPNASLSRENEMCQCPERIAEYNMDIPAGAVSFQRKGKRAIVAFSGLREGKWDEALVLRIAADMDWLTCKDILHLAGDNTHLFPLLN